MNRSYCSDGSRISESVIHDKYARARERKYAGVGVWRCEGCGTDCHGSAHIIAKARCKVIHKSELIWDPNNFFPACNACNQAIENPKGEAWKHLRNIEHCLKVIAKYDPDLYRLFEINAGDFQMPNAA